MKKTVLILLVGLLSACSYLEIDTENKISSSAIDYSTTSDMYKPVIGAYFRLRISGIHWANNMLWCGRDDDMTSGRTDDQGDALLFGYRGGYQCPNSYWALNNAWVTAYEIIRVCNSSLEALDQYATYINKDSEDYKLYLSYVGEVKTIRAWTYYMMVTSFGPCVILKTNNQTYFTRSTVDKVYQYAVEELESAIPDMAHTHPAQMPHVGAYTAYTAEALLARFYMLQGQWAKMEQATQDIINSGQFALATGDTDYYNLFKIPGKLCLESMMEVQCTDFGMDNGDYIGVDQWFNCMGPKITKQGKNIAGWTFMRYNKAFLAWAEARGEVARREVSFIVGGETLRDGWKCAGNAKFIYNGKAYLPPDQMTGNNTEWGRNNNVRLLRYAEVLLMNAEAKVRQGKSGDEPLNMVRTRAGLALLSGATLNDILDERRIELCCEWGLRYTDLCRTGMAITVLNDSTLTRDYAAGAWTTDKTYWPVPGVQLTNTPSLAKDPE